MAGLDGGGHQHVDVARTHPTLYRMIVTVGVWQVALAANFWFAHPPTFSPFGVPKNVVGLVCALLGVTQLLLVGVVRDLCAVRAVLAVSIFCTCSWALLNMEQGIEGKASFQLPISFASIAAWQVWLLLESPVNPMTRRSSS